MTSTPFRFSQEFGNAVFKLIEAVFSWFRNGKSCVLSCLFWSAVFARVRLQYLCYRISLFALSFWVISDYSCVENTNIRIEKSKLRIWAKHSAEQIQYHIQLGYVFEFP